MKVTADYNGGGDGDDGSDLFVSMGELVVQLSISEYGTKDAWGKTWAKASVHLLDSSGRAHVNHAITLGQPEEFLCHEIRNVSIRGGAIPIRNYDSYGSNDCANRCLGTPGCRFYELTRPNRNIKNGPGRCILFADDSGRHWKPDGIIGECHDGGGQSGVGRFRINGARPWTAETPVTYTLLVVLTTASGETEVVRQTVGFRTVTIENGQLQVDPARACGCPVVEQAAIC